VLELPQKLRYSPDFYAAVNGTLYRYFAVVGGIYITAAIASACVLVWLVRRRHPAFEWAALGALFSILSLVSWLAIVRPVNAEVARAAAAGLGSLPEVWARLQHRWEYGHVTGFILQLIAFSALAISSVIETTKEAPNASTIRATVAGVIRAPCERVVGLYTDFRGWPRIFGTTIRGVQLLEDQGSKKTLEVDHVEGRVLNVMSMLASNEIQLEEWKRLYDARFTNRFESVPEGTRYSLVGEVRLKGALAALAPIAKPIVRAKMRRLVLEPLKRSAEASSA
jgi:uncharacterized membrane protein